ncbi:MAG TPA: hypothetical protein VFL41_02660 [Gaiellaceae bacterium]|nr:hypothetical protein [Gaiellaceae bacterium]
MGIHARPTADRIDVIADDHVPDGVWQEAGRHFDADELAGLVWTITVVNGCNRIAISSRIPPAREPVQGAAA